jgi:two-component system osmolarity sensor histidine kinase EnvZ
MARKSFIKRILPRTLLGRSLLIIVTPLVLLQVVSGVIFFESHWDKVSLRMSRNLAGDIAALVALMREYPGDRDRERILRLTGDPMQIVVRLKVGENIPNTPPVANGMMEEMLIRAMGEYVGKPFQIDARTMDRDVIILVQLAEGILEVVAPRKRLFSSTTYVFVLWMVGTSLILFGVATIFMRNQVKPIRRLALAADDFGKGRDVPSFKPEGAAEVRQAASAFIAMRERIQRQITQRTEMLAGVSHDLRTPLTRMKLQLELLRDGDGVGELKGDVVEMEHMLEGYLAFARGEGGEAPQPARLDTLLDDVVAQARRKGGVIDLHTEGEITVALMAAAFRRCVTNVIDNAIRYADHVSVRAGKRGDAIEVTIDDDGPGIPVDKRDDVFKPFYRVETSRNPVTGGVGLGLTIARDVMRNHGGDIELGDSPNGGLRVRLVLPL